MILFLLLQLSPLLIDGVAIPGRDRPGSVKAAVSGQSGDAALHMEKRPQRQGEAFKTLLTHNRTDQKRERVALHQVQQSIAHNLSGKVKIVQPEQRELNRHEALPVHGTLHELLHKQHEDLVLSQRVQKNHVQAHGHLALDDNIQGAAENVAQNRGAAVDVVLVLILVGIVVAVVLYTLQGYTAGIATKGDDEEEEMCPSKLFVECEKKQYAGTYLRIRGEMPNGKPVWKRDGSNDWVFCGTGGQWFVGDEDEKQLNFQCSRGNIASVEEYGGRMPDEIGRGGWLFYDGEKWTKDDSINITSETFTEKNQEEAFKQSSSTAGLDEEGLDEGGPEQSSAATKIQSLHRGNRDRRAANEKKIKKEKANVVPPPPPPIVPPPVAPAPVSNPAPKEVAVAAPEPLVPTLPVETQDSKLAEKTAVEKKPGFLARASTAVKRTTSRSPRPSGRS